MALRGNIGNLGLLSGLSQNEVTRLLLMAQDLDTIGDFNGSLVVNPQVGNDISIDINLRDLPNVALAEDRQFFVELRQLDMFDLWTPGDFLITIGGGGLLQTTSSSTVLARCGSNGQCTIVVTDQNPPSGALVVPVLYPTLRSAPIVVTFLAFS